MPGSCETAAKFPQLAGIENIDLSVKAMLYRSDPRELLLSAAVTWEMGDTGNPAVGGVSPTLFAKPALASQPLVSRVEKFPN